MAGYPPYNPYAYAQQVNPYEQMRNNFQMQQNQYQQPYVQQVAPQNNFLKVVEGIESVNVADVPVDGNPYYFIKPDGSAIYAKRWLPDCTTRVVTYLPVENKQGVVDQKENPLNEELMNRFNMLEEKIDNISKMFSSNSKPVVKNNKKEEVNNDAKSN